MSLLAMLPSPIVYGAIIDKSCILWQKVTSAPRNDGAHLFIYLRSKTEVGNIFRCYSYVRCVIELFVGKGVIRKKGIVCVRESVEYREPRTTTV